jgi:hypothetical protein
MPTIDKNGVTKLEDMLTIYSDDFERVAFDEARHN